MRKLFYIGILVSLFINSGNAQDFPIFSQYISNGLLLSPAYSGSREVLSVSLLYRDQWAGFQGAPVFQSFSAHAPLKNANIGLGLLVLNEQSGPLRNTHVYLNYAYRFNVGAGKLAMGIKAGINFGNYSFKDLLLQNQTQQDPAFSSPNESYLLPNLGAGIYYYSKSAFAGISIPYFFSYKKNSNQTGTGIYNDVNNYDYLITAGYLFNISRNFKIKPSTLIKYNAIYQKQSDLNLNFILLNDLLTVGAAYRMNDKTSNMFEAISGIFEVQFNPQLRIGYAFDYSGGNVNYFNYISHEISIRYEFSYKIKAFNPRYF
jgi:type IX secretion system PorP/SprF family membrane protein